MSRRAPALPGFTVKRMRDARLLNGWSQSDLGDELGVKQATIAQWERGRSMPDVRTQIWIMATLFGDTKGTLWSLPERLDEIELRLRRLER